MDLYARAEWGGRGPYNIRTIEPCSCLLQRSGYQECVATWTCTYNIKELKRGDKRIQNAKCTIFQLANCTLVSNASHSPSEGVSNIPQGTMVYRFRLVSSKYSDSGVNESTPNRSHISVVTLCICRGLRSSWTIDFLPPPGHIVNRAVGLFQPH